MEKVGWRPLIHAAGQKPRFWCYPMASCYRVPSVFLYTVPGIQCRECSSCHGRDGTRNTWTGLGRAGVDNGDACAMRYFAQPLFWLACTSGLENLTRRRSAADATRFPEAGNAVDARISFRNVKSASRVQSEPFPRLRPILTKNSDTLPPHGARGKRSLFPPWPFPRFNSPNFKPRTPNASPRPDVFSPRLPRRILPVATRLIIRQPNILKRRRAHVHFVS